MKLIVSVLVIAFSSQALAGGDGSKMGGGGGMRPMDIPRPPMPSNNYRPPPMLPFQLPPEIFQPLPKPPVVTVPQPVDNSTCKTPDIVNAFKTFNSISTGAVTDQDVDTFVTTVASCILGVTCPCSQNIIKRSKYAKEKRLVYKILIAGIIYITNPSDTDVVTFLQQNNITQQEFQALDAQRASIKSSGISIVAALGNLSSVTYQPSSVLAKRFIQER